MTTSCILWMVEGDSIHTSKENLPPPHQILKYAPPLHLSEPLPPSTLINGLPLPVP